MRWRPDTCDCVIMQDVVAGEVVCTSVESKCQTHAALSDADAIAAVHLYPTGENRRKNLLVAHIAQTYGVAWDAVAWAFTGTGNARVLEVTPSGLNNSNKNAAQTFANATFGTGKAIVK